LQPAVPVVSGGQSERIADDSRRLLKNPSPTCILTSAAKAATENQPFIAALKRCATQNQVNIEFFSSLLELLDSAMSGFSRAATSKKGAG